jgi:hypothetical protein
MPVAEPRTRRRLYRGAATEANSPASAAAMVAQVPATPRPTTTTSTVSSKVTVPASTGSIAPTESAGGAPGIRTW